MSERVVFRKVVVFEKLVNNRIVDHLEKCGLFADFQYGFRSSRSTADLLTVVSDRITRAFNRSWATRAVALDISKAFDRVWHAGLLHKLKSYGISGQIFGLISSFLSNRQLRVVLDGKSFDRSKNTGAIDVKMDGSVLEDKTSFKMMTFSSKLDWGSYIVCIGKTASKKIGVLIRSMNFLSLEVALYLYKSTIQPCMEYCCHV